MAASTWDVDVYSLVVGFSLTTSRNAQKVAVYSKVFNYSLIDVMYIVQTFQIHVYKRQQ